MRAPRRRPGATAAAPSRAPRAFPHLWVEAISSRNIAKVLELYLPTAVLVPTLNADLLKGKDQLTRYFHRLLVKDNFRADLQGVVPQRAGKIASFSGAYTFRWTENGRAKVLPARYTFVVVPTRVGARILTHHSSEVPQ